MNHDLPWSLLDLPNQSHACALSGVWQVALPTDDDLAETGAADAGEYLLALQDRSPIAYRRFLESHRPRHTDPDGKSTGEPNSLSGPSQLAWPILGRPTHATTARLSLARDLHVSGTPSCPGEDYEKHQLQPIWRCVEHLIKLLVRTVEFNTQINRPISATDGGVDDDEAKRFLRQRIKGIALDRSAAAYSMGSIDFEAAMENVQTRA